MTADSNVTLDRAGVGPRRERVKSLVDVGGLPPGWLLEGDEWLLAETTKSVKPKVYLEIGTFCGRSAKLVYDLLPDGAEMHCVDPWRHYNSRERRDISDFELDDPFTTFKDQVLSKAVPGKAIHAHQMTSKEAFEKDVVEWADMVFIDGDHAHDAVYSDFEMWSQKTNLILFHDVIEVRGAANKFLANHSDWKKGVVTVAEEDIPPNIDTGILIRV